MLRPPLWRAARVDGGAWRPRCSEVLPALIVGAYPTPEDAAWLRAEHRITAVLSLQDDADLASKGLQLDGLRTAYDAAGVRFERAPLTDNDVDMLRLQLPRIVAQLDALLAHDHRVYLHCNAGVNRAPTVAIAYLHARCGLPLEEARDHVKARLHCVPYMRLLAEMYSAATPCR